MTIVTPILLYLGITIVVPMLNGAPADAAFVRHAVIVVGVSAFAVLVAALARHLGRHSPTRRTPRTIRE